MLAGTRAAVARISRRSDVNSEIVLVFDTITTLVDVGLDGGGVTQRSDDHQLEAELAERLQRLLRELRAGLGERLIEHQPRENRCVVGAFGLARLKLSTPARQNAISFSYSPPELSPALLLPTNTKLVSIVNDGLLFVSTNWAWAYSFCISQVLPAVSCQTIHARFTG